MSTTTATTAVTPARRTLLGRLWPAALGILVAVASAYGLADGRELAAVVAASGFVYLAAAAVGRRGAAWPAFLVTFVLIGASKVVDADPVPILLGAAAVILVVGLARGGLRPAWSLPLQAAAMLVLGGVALLALQLSPTAGGLLVAVGLLAHAAWDVHHHRTGRVVSRSLAEFCAVLDVLLAVLVAIIAVAA